MTSLEREREREMRVNLNQQKESLLPHQVKYQYELKDPRSSIKANPEVSMFITLIRHVQNS